MSVDVFGRTLIDNKKVKKGPPGIGFLLTDDGNFNIDGKRLCNIASPEDSNDAINLNFLKTFLESKVWMTPSVVIADNYEKILNEQRTKLNDFLKNVVFELLMEWKQFKHQRGENSSKIDVLLEELNSYDTSLTDLKTGSESPNGLVHE